MAQASAAAVLRSGYLAHTRRGRRGRARDRPLVDARAPRRVAARRHPPGAAARRAARLPLRARRCTSGSSTASSPASAAISLLAGVYGGAGAAAREAADAGRRRPERDPARSRPRSARSTAALTAVRERLRLPADGERRRARGAGGGEGDRRAGARAPAPRRGGVRFDRLGVAASAGRPAGARRRAGRARRRRSTRSSDALTAEGVFQLVRGNPARAAASVDAIAHGEIQPPELQFAETPRPGHGADAPARRRLQRRRAPAAPAGVRAARRAAEPKLDAWLAQMVGDPKIVRLRAEFLDDDRRGAARGARTCGSTSLGLSNLDALYLERLGEPGCPPTSSGCSSTAPARGARETSRRTRALRLDYGRGAGDAADRARASASSSS